MNRSSRMKYFLFVLAWFLVAVAVTFLIYRGSIPQRYSFRVGELSPVDIAAPRDVRDDLSTVRRAEEAKLKVPRIYVRSSEVVSKTSGDLDMFFSIATEIRTERFSAPGLPSPAATESGQKLVEAVQEKLDIVFPLDQAIRIVSLAPYTAEVDGLYNDFLKQTVSTGALIMTEKVVDEDALAAVIDVYLSEEKPDSDSSLDTTSEISRTILSLILVPNMEFDEEATSIARESAYRAAMNDPDIIQKGARILSQGEEITQEKFEILALLDMIEKTTFDYAYLLRMFFYVCVVTIGLCIYLLRGESGLLKSSRTLAALGLCLLVTLVSAIYLSDISHLLIPVFFPAVIIAIYLGTQSGFILSLLLILLLLPVSGFEPEFLFVAAAGSFTCSLLAGDRKRKYNSALLILLTGCVCLLSSIVFNLLIKTNSNTLFQSAIWAGVCGAISVILAIGLMPIFELISNSISPIRLIDLSQPSQPLQKKLFVEAPGTYQHSMMVATLSESAAEEIGANALLAKVGAYYHDIGKLENPEYFTENQTGENPHDLLSPEESFGILLGHVENGVRLARKNRLPAGIIRFIQEHHGTTFQAFFYHKAKELAELRGESEPPMKNFKYRGPIPSSKESAIVMLADTCEAAIKSTGIRTLTEAQDLFRKLIKQKIDQDQLTNSGLSFTDIESIIKSFVQVYTGVFHERIKYPDDHSNRK